MPKFFIAASVPLEEVVDDIGKVMIPSWESVEDTVTDRTRQILLYHDFVQEKTMRAGNTVYIDVFRNVAHTDDYVKVMHVNEVKNRFRPEMHTVFTDIDVRESMNPVGQSLFQTFEELYAQSGFIISYSNTPSL